MNWTWRNVKLIKPMYHLVDCFNSFALVIRQYTFGQYSNAGRIKNIVAHVIHDHLHLDMEKKRK